MEFKWYIMDRFLRQVGSWKLFYLQDNPPKAREHSSWTKLTRQPSPAPTIPEQWGQEHVEASTDIPWATNFNYIALSKKHFLGHRKLWLLKKTAQEAFAAHSPDSPSGTSAVPARDASAAGKHQLPWFHPACSSMAHTAVSSPPPSQWDGEIIANK